VVIPLSFIGRPAHQQIILGPSSGPVGISQAANNAAPSTSLSTPQSYGQFRLAYAVGRALGFEPRHGADRHHLAKDVARLQTRAMSCRSCRTEPSACAITTAQAFSSTLILSGDLPAGIRDVLGSRLHERGGGWALVVQFGYSFRCNALQTPKDENTSRRDLD